MKNLKLLGVFSLLLFACSVLTVTANTSNKEVVKTSVKETFSSPTVFTVSNFEVIDLAAPVQSAFALPVNVLKYDSLVLVATNTLRFDKLISPSRYSIVNKNSYRNLNGAKAITKPVHLQSIRTLQLT